MSQTPRSTSPRLAEIRARTALRGAGLDPTTPLERASSVTNEVWLTTDHVVRVNRHPNNRLYRETLVAAVLPPEVGYPRIVAHGGGRGEDWLIAERIPGQPLAHVWPRLDDEQRQRAVHQLASRLRAVHETVAPSDLPAIEGAPQLLEVGSSDPAAPLRTALERARQLPYVDPALFDEAAALLERVARVLDPFDSPTLVHGDVTFENVIWHDGDVVALVDLEWARRGPRDLDLDILLRCAAYPQLHVDGAYEAVTRPADYAEVPWWLARAYPGLFDFAAQLDRVRIYSIAYDVRDLLSAPPSGPVHHLPELHAYHRLERVVRRHSYLDVLSRDRS